MPEVGVGYVPIKPDLASFGQELERGVEAPVRRVGDRLSSVGSKMTIGLTAPLVAGFALATSAASDLAEATNVTGLVFDKSRGKIDAFAENAAEGLGQSERAAREATSTFGGLLQNLGLAEEQSADWSITLATLASDLGSSFNKEPSVAVEALGAALRGETEPLRQFNVVLDDATVKQRAVELGLAATTAEVDKSAKAQATLSLIMEQTAAVQGDFANTSDGLANQQRILRARLEDTTAQLGTQLLPIATKVVGAVSGVLDVFSGLTDAQQTAVIAGAGIVAGLGPVITVAGNVIKVADGISSAIGKIGPGNLVAGGIVLGGLALLTDALMSARREADELVDSLVGDVDFKSLTSMREGLEAIESELETQMEEWHRYDGVKGIIQGTVEVLTPLENKVLDNSQAVKGLEEAQSDLLRQATHLQENLATLQNELGLDEAAARKLADRVGLDLSGSFNDVVPVLRDAYEQVRSGTVQSDRLAEATSNLTSEVATAEEQVKAFEDAVDSLLGSQLDAEESQIRLRQKTAELSEAVAKGAQEDESAAAFRDRLALETIDVVDATRDEIDALVRSGEVSADAADQQAALRDRLTELRDRFPGLRDQIQVYIDKLNAIPVSQTTRIDLETGSAFAGLRNFMDTLQRVPRTVATQLVTIGGAGAPHGRASGGPVKAMQPYIVGEVGPELFVPKVSGTIVPNARLEAANVSGISSSADLLTELRDLNGAIREQRPIIVSGVSDPTEAARTTALMLRL